MSHSSFTDRMYNAWEQQTAEYLEKLLRNPGFLEMSGGLLSGAMRSKVLVNDLLMATWKTMMLPNKRDQERTLHLLNELHSRVQDMEDRIEDNEQHTSKDSGSEALQELSQRVDRLSALVEKLVSTPTTSKKPTRSRSRTRS